MTAWKIKHYSHFWREYCRSDSGLLAETLMGSCQLLSNVRQRSDWRVSGDVRGDAVEIAKRMGIWSRLQQEMTTLDAIDL